MFSQILFLIFIIFESQSSAQVPVNDTRFGSFNVQIRSLISSENVRPEFRCMGTLISFKHVLTAASCVSDLGANRIVVNVGTTALLGEGDDSVFDTLADINIHPEFVQGQVLKGNIAVLTIRNTRNKINASRFEPQTISTTGLQEFEGYSMTGFSGMRRQLGTTFLFVFPPNSTRCDSNFPKAFCSDAEIYTVNTCGGYLGAALFDSRDNAIRGIVIVDEFCTTVDNQFGNFHSMNDFRDWILEITGAGQKVAISLLMILSCFVATFVNSMKC